MAISLTVMEATPIQFAIESTPTVDISADAATLVNVNDYMALRNKPSIEGVLLEGDKSFEELNLQSLTNTELENMLTL